MREAHGMELLELCESFQQHNDFFNDLMQPMEFVCFLRVLIIATCSCVCHQTIP